MVATLTIVASTNAAERYYLDNQASVRPKADYYAVGKEPDGVWLNPAGLFNLPDHKRVTTADFHKLFWGFSPSDGAKLTRNSGSPSRAASFDLTLSADKSISALWAIADPELRTEIEHAHNDAAREAYERWMLGECAHTRRTDKNGNLEVVPADLIAAMFQHGESREQDPQLHTHIVCFNIARTRDDGKYRAHHQHPAFMWVKTMGSWYRAALAWNLQERLGIRMEQYGDNNEFSRIAGMPEQLIQSWSKRRGKILAWAKAQGVTIAGNPALAESANLNTRKHKTNLGTREAQLRGWLQHAQTLVPHLEALIRELRGHDIEIGPEEIRNLVEHLRTVPDDLMRSEAIVRLPAIIAEIANRSAAILKPAAIQTAVARVLRDPAFVELEPRPTIDSAAGLRHTEVFTTKHTLLLEETVTELAEAMQQATGYGIHPAAVDAKITALKTENYPLSDEQIAAIRAAATSDGRIAVIEGAAGSGKTTTLRPLADLWRDAGKNIIATAVPWRTAMALGTDVDAPMFSVAKLLSMAARDQLDVDRNGVIIADEAGMLSTREIHHLMQLSEKTGAKILFCGDTQQQQPVEAGPGLRLVRDVVGSSRIATMRRQKADIEDILRHRHGLSPEAARAEAETLSAADRESILAEFEASPQASDLPFKPWQIAASEAFRDGDTHHAIAAYRDRGRFHLCRNSDTAIEKIADDVARYTEENPGKTITVMARTNHDRRAISRALRRRALGDTPRNSHVIQVSDREDGRHRTELEVAEGDRLRIGATHWQKQLFNGSVVIIDDLELSQNRAEEESRLRIEGHTEDGRAVSFDHDEIRDYYGNVRLDHGYALTITSAQGLTVDAAFLLADSRSARETMYPAATRHRERLNIYVDRNRAAHEVDATRIDRDKATTDRVVTDDEIVEHLEKSWKRSSPKQAAHDYRLRQRREPQPHGPDLDPTPGPAPEIDRLVREDREHALELRYGNEVAALASGRRQVLRSYAELRARAAAGDNVADEPAFRETIERHAVLVTAAERFRTRPQKFAQLLKRRGDLTADDLQDFRHRLKRARDFRRGRAISKTMAGRAPAAARRRAANPRRIDLRQPLPDRVADDIGRELEALVPEGPALDANVTAISPAGGADADARDSLDAAASLERAWHEQPPTPDAGDGRAEWSDDGWSGEDPAEHADSMKRSAAIAAPDAGHEMPEDPGWAEYAASLDAGSYPPAEPAPAPLAPAARDATQPAPAPPAPEIPDAARDPAPPRPAAPAVSRTDAEFEGFERRRQAIADTVRRDGTDPWQSPDWPRLRVAAMALLRRPDLSEARRAEIDDLLARDHLDTIVRALDSHAADLASMTAETKAAGTPLDAHTRYPAWLARGAQIQRTAGDAFDARARLTDAILRKSIELLTDAKFARLGQDLRRAALLAGARRELAPAAADLKVRHAVVREAAVREYDTFLKDTQKHHVEAQAAGVHPLYHRGADDLYRRATHLRDKDYLPEAHRTEIAAFCRRVETFTAAHDLVREVDDQLQNQAGKRFVHQIHVTPSADQHTPLLHRSETPEYPESARQTDGLLAQAAAIAADPDTYRVHLDHAPDLRDRLAQNTELLSALRADDTNIAPADALLADLRERSLAVAREAHADEISWIDHHDTPDLLKHADLLTKREDLSPASRDAVVDFQAQYVSAVEARRDTEMAQLRTPEPAAPPDIDRAERLNRQLQAHFASRSAMHRASMDANHTISDHRDYGAWKSRTDDLLQQIELIVGDPDDRAALSMASPGLGSSLAHDGEMLVKAIADDARYLALSRSPPRQHIPAVPAPQPIEHAIPPLPDPQTINDQLEAYWDARQPIRQAAIAASQPTAAHPDYQIWKSHTEALIHAARAILHEASPYEDELDANPALRSDLRSNSDLLTDAIATDARNLKIAAPAPDPRPAITPTPKSEDDQAPDITPDFDDGPSLGL